MPPRDHGFARPARHADESTLAREIGTDSGTTGHSVNIIKMIAGQGVTWTRRYLDKVLSRQGVTWIKRYLDKMLPGQGVIWTKIDVTWTRCYRDKTLPGQGK